MEIADIDGLMMEAFKIFIGNPDIAVGLVAFIIFAGLTITALQLYEDFRD